MFGGTREFRVQMERLWIERHGRKQQVVCFRDGATGLMLEFHPDIELFEVFASHLP